ncbi:MULTISPECIES: DUF4385 domain-containing protein [Asticcacaulis]|uniref:DUF4385 domain-containing protein n=1 Tax=Asticcacaulis TaxID=76890 RepID=UPI001AE61013|nr:MULTISPECIES: DUF4385 domain-containing protein [Asticcacaulis]MBP2159116.1 hypothetical protein [Asticcacaulis solisilvae]MDR6800161.1 hypothetical protein [Asticcacaulis sp. BE141]
MPDSTQKPSYLDFDKASYAWKPDIDYRKHPEAYQVGKGEQGVLIVEPYKSELVPLWRFKTPDIAEASSTAIFERFETYLKDGDFVGADMARKFLQMGYTRARRYANYKGGKKYDAEHGHAALDRGTGDPVKAESARIFYDKWRAAEANSGYADQKKAWKKRFG